MKRSIILGAILLVDIVMALPALGAGLNFYEYNWKPWESEYIPSKPCEGIEAILINQRVPNKEALIRDALDKYKDHKGADKYQLCFEITGDAIEIASPLIFEHDADKEVIISGLKLKLKDMADSPSFDDPLLTISNTTSKVILLDTKISDASNALLLSGAAHEISGGEIACGAKGGAGIHVKADGAAIDGVKVYGCGDGILVEANDVKIQNGSEIYDNGIGVRVAAGFSGAEIEKTKFYYNDDGDSSLHKRYDAIRIEDAPERMNGFNVKDKGVIQAIDLSPDEIIHYDGKTPYLTPPPNDMLSDLKVELFLSENNDCGLSAEYSARYQGCGFVDSNMPMLISADDLKVGEVEIPIPPESRNKNLLAVFTDSKGSTGFSHKFNLGDGPIVLIGVAEPISIPSTGSEARDGVDIGAGYAGDDLWVESTELSEDKEGGVSVGGAVISGSDAAGSGGIPAGAKMCSLDPRPAGRTVSIWLGLWWIITAIAVIMAIRPIRQRIRRR